MAYPGKKQKSWFMENGKNKKKDKIKKWDH